MVWEKYLSSSLLCTGMKSQQMVKSWMHFLMPLVYRTAFKVNWELLFEFIGDERTNLDLFMQDQLFSVAI